MKCTTVVGASLLLLCLMGIGAEAYLVGAWNIQVFGLSKISEPDVVDVIIDTLKRYDVVLIQEIRDASETAIFELLEILQDEDSSYQMIVGPRLGRSSSKEQYAYIWRSSDISLVSSYTYSDRGDRFEREPMIAEFETPEGFTFALVGCHVRPDDAVAEIDALADVYEDVRDKLRLDNIMLLGDFNADCQFVTNSEYGDLVIFHSSTYTSLLNIDTTLAASSCAYDRILLTGDLNEVAVLSSADVFRYDTAFRLSQAEAEDVSDHYPVEVRIEPAGFITKQVFYKNDFRSSVDDRWNSDEHGRTPNGMRFLGNFAVDNHPVELTIDSREIPRAEVREDFLLEFQLYVIGVWNGEGDSGPDFFEVEVEGVTRFRASFCNAASASDTQSFPGTKLTDENPCKTGAFRRNSLGYGNDAVYQLSVPFRYRSGPLNVVFRAYTEGREESKSSESWGLDSVELSFVGSPPTSKAMPVIATSTVSVDTSLALVPSLHNSATIGEQPVIVVSAAPIQLSFDPENFSSAPALAQSAATIAALAVIWLL